MEVATLTEPAINDWWTRKVTSGEQCDLLNAKNMLWQIAEAAWACGDPGMQFDGTINSWNPVLDMQRINASNPCSEFMFVDDSSCNLASLNLMKFRKADGGFDSDAFAAAVGTFIVAQDILVSRGGYPTPEIERNSHEFRPLGLGYANLGALLMSIGLPYDSDQGRDLAAAITSFMTASAYKMSGLIAKRKGPFHWFGEVQRSFLHVIGLHSRASDDLLQRIQAAGEANSLCLPLVKAANETWGPVINMCMGSGLRNAQVTLLAPTGTIGFMMDCATTGIEPELSLVKYKSLVGGGQLKLVNPIAEVGLRYLYRDAAGLAAFDLEPIIDFMKEHGHVVESGLDPTHYAVFDTSFATLGSDRFIEPMGHVKMMAAVQPFLSGAISKTVNLPESATIEQVQQVFIDAWKLGLKSVAVYRNGCKKSQPLNMTKDVVAAPVDSIPRTYVSTPVQRKMPDTRNSVTHEFKVGGQKAFLIVGLYSDGSPGEIFLDIAKEGSTLSGMVDAWAIAFSFNLQYGVPLTKLIERFSYMRFDPSGFTSGELGFAHSIVDYVVRWLEAQFIKTKLPFIPLIGAPATAVAPSLATGGGIFTGDAPPCTECGAIMTRSGSCFRCVCGSTSGCS
jgi:ribonucleoside-diphosphate reductase alpha chain